MEKDAADCRDSTIEEEEEMVWENCSASGKAFWHKLYRVADTRETSLEPMMLSNPTDCRPNKRACETHRVSHMMQIFSLKLVHTTEAIDSPIQLYGFVAARDLLNPLRNYIFNRTRDDPFVVEQQSDGSGSYIQMTGPKRGIEMKAQVLIEYDMKIKKGETQEDDLQLIDGAACFSELDRLPSRVCTRRIEGDSGAVDLSLALLHRAVEATVQVKVSQVHGSGLNLSMSSLVGRISPRIQLFKGVIAEPCDLNRFVIAVVKGNTLILDLIVHQREGSGHARPCYPFKAKLHGHDIQEFKLDFATIVVKVSWSTLVPYRGAHGLL
ncbi:hypothetical protein EJB05_29743, partial [Eragrostis curvula]